ncbi:MAG: carboxypeptidase regulatory-like domain-containing protein [Planctomycetota bacterium]
MSCSVQDDTTSASTKLRAGRANSIAGRVAWPDGTPAAGATVEWRSMHDPVTAVLGRVLGEKRRAVVTGDAGTFAIEDLEDSAFVVDASAHRAPLTESARKEVPWRVRRTDVRAGTRDLALVLAPPAAVFGRVIDDAGQPIERFRVRAVRSVRTMRSQFGDAAAEGRFEARDGHFELAGVPDGEVELEVDAPGVTQTVPVLARVPDDAGPHEILLVRNARVVGTVVDSAGATVAGAVIELRDDLGNKLRAPQLELEDLRTDERGRFDLDVPARVLNVFAWSDGWADSRVERLVLYPAQSRELELSLCAGGQIVGEVVGRDGKPEANRALLVRRTLGRSLPDVVTDEAGRFEVGALGPGTYRVQIRELDLDRIRSTLVDVRDGETSRVTIGETGRARIRVHGTVRADEIPRADVRVIARRRANNPNFESVDATTDASGRFELGLAEPGTHAFELAGGSTETLRWVRVPDRTEFELDLELPTGSIAGRLVGPDGAPLSDVPVELKPDAASTDCTPTYTAGSQDTDAAGAFVFENVGPASYRLQAGRVVQGGASIAPPFGQATREGIEVIRGARVHVELAMSKGCALVGSIRYEDDGARGTGIEVFGRDESGALLDGDDLALTDSSGRFRIEGLPRGKATFFARGVGYASHETPPIEIDPSRAASVDIVLAMATRLYVDVIDEAGKVVSRVQVRVFDERGRDCKVRLENASPRDELDGQLEGTFPPGTYRVTARHEDGRHAEDRVTLAGTPAVSLALRLGR